jgi:hypothetical protein
MLRPSSGGSTAGNGQVIVIEVKSGETAME